MKKTPLELNIPGNREQNLNEWGKGYWLFTDGQPYSSQPLGFFCVNVGIDMVWAIEINGCRQFPDEGSVIEYNDNKEPIRIISPKESELLFGDKALPEWRKRKVYQL